LADLLSALCLDVLFTQYTFKFSVCTSLLLWQIKYLKRKLFEELHDHESFVATEESVLLPMLCTMKLHIYKIVYYESSHNQLTAILRYVSRHLIKLRQDLGDAKQYTIIFYNHILPLSLCLRFYKLLGTKLIFSILDEVGIQIERSKCNLKDKFAVQLLVIVLRAGVWCGTLFLDAHGWSRGLWLNKESNQNEW